MSDTSEKSSGTRGRSGTIVAEHKEAINPENPTAVTILCPGPHIIVSAASPLSPPPHSGTTQEFKLPYYLAEWSTGASQYSEHDTKENSKAASEESSKVDGEPTITPRKEKGKILTEEEEKQAVDEAYKALMEEEYTPPSR